MRAVANPVEQHTVNAAVAAAPFISILADLPVVISSLVGIAALWYYYLVISKELRARRAEKEQLKASTTRVIEKIKSEN